MAVLFTGKEAFSGPATTGLAHRNATPLAHYAVSILHYGGRVRAAETDGANVIASRMPLPASSCAPNTYSHSHLPDGNLFQPPVGTLFPVAAHPAAPVFPRIAILRGTGHPASRFIAQAHPAPPVPQSSLSQSALARARELVTENREADAAALLERGTTPGAAALHREIALRAATNALHARDISAATAWLDRGLSRNPADPELNFFRGNLLLDSGHAAAAAERFRLALAADPQRLEFALALAAALLAVGAPAEIPALLAPFSDSAQAQLLRAQAWERLGDLAEASNACTHAVRLQPDRTDIWLHLASLREKTGDPLGALVARTHASAIQAADAAPAPSGD